MALKLNWFNNKIKYTRVKDEVFIPVLPIVVECRRGDGQI